MATISAEFGSSASPAAVGAVAASTAAASRASNSAFSFSHSAGVAGWASTSMPEGVDAAAAAAAAAVASCNCKLKLNSSAVFSSAHFPAASAAASASFFIPACASLHFTTDNPSGLYAFKCFFAISSCDADFSALALIWSSSVVAVFAASSNFSASVLVDAIAAAVLAVATASAAVTRSYSATSTWPYFSSSCVVRASHLAASCFSKSISPAAPSASAVAAAVALRARSSAAAAALAAAFASTIEPTAVASSTRKDALLSLTTLRCSIFAFRAAIFLSPSDAVFPTLDSRS